jgi:tetratricopeptide (TPR) repeat protein
MVSLAAPPAPAKPAAPAAASISPLDMSDLLKAGDAAFNSGDYQTAATKLSQYAANAEKLGITEKLDVIVYVTGLSYAQLKQWPKALEFLKQYETKFPTAEYIKDVQMLIGKVHALSGDFKTAATQFEKIRNFPDLKEQVLPLLAEAYERSDQGGEAVRVLEEYLRAGYNSTERINSALRLAKLYLDSDNTDKGVEILDKIKNSPSAADFVIIINAKAIETAAKLIEDDKPELGLIALQAVRRKSEVLRLQQSRNKVLQAKIAEWTRIKAATPGAAGAKFQTLIEEGTARLKQLEELQAGVEKDDSYDAVVIYNIGRCFDKLKRYWESELAFRTVATSYKTFANVSSALFGQIVSLVNLKKKEEAKKLCKDYLKQFPKTPEASTVAELAVTLAMEAGEFESVNKLVDEILTIQPDNPSANKLLLYSIGSDFELYNFKGARGKLEQYRKKYPNDPFKEEIDYRYALTYFFENDYKKTLELLNKYGDDYPNGLYRADTQYRLGIVMYGAEMQEKGKAEKSRTIDKHESNFRQVIDNMRDLINRDPNTQVAGEVYALIGDCYDQMTYAEAQVVLGEEGNSILEAGLAYKSGASKATNDSVLDYCMEQARTKLQSVDRWKDIREMYEDFVKSRPNHAQRLQGIYWVCRARSREAKTPEEKAQASEFVKKYLSTEIMTNINRANTEGVEMLIEQLAQACIPKRRPRPMPASGDAPASTQIPVDEDPYIVGARELDKWLGGDSGKLNGTGQTRLQYAKIQLMKMVPPKVDPADPKKKIDRTPEIDKLMDELAQNAKPDDLSATLSAFIGEHLLKRGVTEKATQCFNRLMQSFPKSDFLDFALVGLGDIAFEQKDYAQAEKYYGRARDEMPGMKYPNALLGVAKSQFNQGNFKDMDKSLLEVVGTKEYKGPLHAEALYWLGKAEFAKKDFAKAANYYQRIFLSYAKFTDWAIKGYCEAAHSFKALGEPDKAKKHLEEAREFLKKKKLENTPLMADVKEKAGELGITLGI